MRIVWDCRAANMHFRSLPDMDMGGGEALQRVELQGQHQLFVAQADVENCFYQCALPAWASPYFALEPVSVDNTREMGTFVDIKGNPLPDSGRIYPVLVVYPMGWSWAFWLVQKLRERVAEQCGFNAERCLVGAWPAPAITADCAALPYRDNLTVYGVNADQVGAGIERMINAFSSLGFDLHEISGVEEVSSVLGYAVNLGRTGRLRPKPERVWKLRAALLWILNVNVTGLQIQVLLGLYVSMALVSRGALAAPRALYDFVEACDGKPRRLWPSAAYEVTIMIGLLPLIVSDMSAPWSPTLTATDASSTGYGVCTRDVAHEQAAELGRWSERWRYRRLDPSEWCPRKRTVEPLDVLADPRTIFPHLRDDTSFREREGFPEVPADLMRPKLGRTVFSAPLRTPDHITALEGRSALWAVRNTLKHRSAHGVRHVRIVDNFGLALAFEKGRATAYDMLQLCRRLGSMTLATGAKFFWRWVPSEWNPSDEPSRRFESAARSLLGSHVRHPADESTPPGRPPPAVWSSALVDAKLRWKSWAAAWTHREAALRRLRRRRARGAPLLQELVPAPTAGLQIRCRGRRPEGGRAVGVEGLHHAVRGPRHRGPRCRAATTGHPSTPSRCGVG